MSRSILNFISLLCKLFPWDWVSSPLEDRWRAIHDGLLHFWCGCSALFLWHVVQEYSTMWTFLSSSQYFWVFLLSLVAAIPSLLKSVSWELIHLTYNILVSQAYTKVCGHTFHLSLLDLWAGIQMHSDFMPGKPQEP